MNGLIEGKKYVLSTPVDTVITDVKYNIPLGTVKAGQQYVFQAVSDAVTVADGCTIRPFEGSNGASVGVVGGGEGGSSGGSSAYPGWVGYIEYDDETGEAIAADYSGLEIGGVVPDSLKFETIKFRGDWNGSIGKFTNGSSMFYSCDKLTSFNGDLSNLKNGNNMFAYCTNLTSFTGDLSSLTEASQMFQTCENLTSFNCDDLSSLTIGQAMFKSCTNLTSFSSDLSNMTNGYSMFGNCTNLTSFSSDLSSLTNGEGMFQWCTNLTSFSSDLSSLTNGLYMFNFCKLDAPSVERILTTIPEYTDGSSHTLTMAVQSGEGAAKFGEITGTTPTSSQISVNFKGWTVKVSIEK